jgi:hypothetical protein
MIMSMKIMKLPAYWDAADAQLVIGFLDDLRDLLVDTYGDEIIDMHQRMAESSVLNEDQIELPFNDPLEF